jgi:hypothetical protein
MANAVGKTARHALLTVTHDQLGIRVIRAMHDQHAPLTETHAQRATNAVHATSVQLASSKIAQHVHSTATHDQSEPSTAMAAHASLTTALASLTAFFATQTRTADQTVPTAWIATAIATVHSTALARATQTRRLSSKTRSLSA